MGSDPRGPHFWVLTIDSTAGGAFWEPLTGRRYALSEAVRPGGTPYVSLDALFDDAKVLVNVQRDNVLLTCHLDFDDARCWRPFALGTEDCPGAQSPDGGAYVPAQLRDSAAALTCAIPQLEARLEADLKRRIAAYRADELGIQRTVWDAALEPLLMPALEAYEREAVTGAPYPGNEEFTESIRAAVPAGHTFQGHPSHHTTLDPHAMFEALSCEAPAVALLRADGQGTAFALRVKVTAYAEDVCSVWCMLAAKVAPMDPSNRVVYRPSAKPVAGGANR